MNGNLAKKGGAGKSDKRKPDGRSPIKAKAQPSSKSKKTTKTALVKLPRKATPRKAPKHRLPQRPKAPILYHPGPSIDSQSALEAAAAQLLALDPELVGKLVAIGGATLLRRQEPGFAGLIRIIVAQQVSTASANAIFKRVETILAPLSARTVLDADDDKLRACGLSMPKMRAFRAIAQAVADGLDLIGLGALVAEEAHRALVAVKGIGPWTADVFLLFCLGHPDAFPSGDIALQEAAKIALELKQRPDARRLEEIAERWRPLRGVAAYMLWAYYRAARQRVGMALEGAPE
ncbi:DNA-3-methyladenine glycosylase [Methylocapsa sp. S129]|uniref:DNA-3-methyladenine glycosylase family protein n=1 Tax=Methylocapsa sp. S129 TaxID=1641869 RepID=UPI00131C69BC|nr:DNA-3-methyladenine glycosylase 2 family protein [Methylocapsa sp. S129]